jgi:hypothetical protein
MASHIPDLISAYQKPAAMVHCLTDPRSSCEIPFSSNASNDSFQLLLNFDALNTDFEQTKVRVVKCFLISRYTLSSGLRAGLTLYDSVEDV